MKYKATWLLPKSTTPQYTLIYTNDNEVDEMPDKEFKCIIIRMINKINKDTDVWMN
jgi:hypothetical protein